MNKILKPKDPPLILANGGNVVKSDKFHVELNKERHRSEKIFEAKLRAEVYQLIVELEPETLSEETQILLKEKQRLLDKKRISAGQLLFFTINPRPNTSPEELTDSIHKWLCLTWTPEIVYYTLEQRGDSIHNMGVGLHAHILCLKPTGGNTNLSKLKTDTLRVFSHLYSQSRLDAIDKKTNKPVLLKTDYKTYPASYMKEKIAYIDGTEKWDTAKHTKQSIDKIWRDKLEMPVYYEINTLEYK